MMNQNLNPLFHKILSKPIPQWILATETAMIQLYHTVYENTKKRLIPMPNFNKTYHNPRPLDIGTFVLKRNFLHVHFSDKLKPLRIGPFKIINKLSDITYEIVNQDGYTSHIHRNHLIPYYPKEPVIFPFIQQYSPHLFNDCHSNTNDQIINSDEDKYTDEEQFPSTTFNKETDIPSTIDLQSEQFNQYSSFHINKKNKFLKIPPWITNQIFMIMIILLIPEDTPIIDTISAHNQEKTIDSSLVKRI